MAQPTQSLRARATTGDVAQRPEQPSIGALIQQLRPEMQRALPKHMDADRMARLALTVLRKTPALSRCSPESFMGALLTAAQLGLELGATNEAYLVPYGREAQFIVGYQGLVKLFYQHPLAKHVDSQAVFEHDTFDYEYGLTPSLRHKPAIGDRGNVVAYYAVGTLTSGASAFVVLSPQEVAALRQGKVGPSGNIADPQRWMERKTVLRQLFKMLPKSTELSRALVADEGVRTNLDEHALDEAPRYPAAVPAAQAPAQVEQAPVGVDPATGELEEPRDLAEPDLPGEPVNF